MISCGYCLKISHGDSQGLIAARRAGEDFVRNQEAGGSSNNGSTVHPAPPEIPLRLRRALSGKPESSTAFRMTRTAAQNFHYAARKQAILCLHCLPWVAILLSVKVFEGVIGGTFVKKFPLTILIL